KPVAVNVKKGNGTRPLIAGHLVNVKKDTPSTFLERIFAIRWFLIAAMVALGALLFFFTKREKDKNNVVPLIKSEAASAEQTEKVSEPEIPENPLREAEEMLLENNVSHFYPVINNCLRKYLSLKLQFPERELNKKKINELLDKHNVGVG